MSLLLSKSSVQICENRGLHGQGDPQDLVNEKACEKKLVVVMTVKNEQNGTEKLLAQVSRVRDASSSEYARLYNPFLITLAKSPVMINYPYTFTGYAVNNKPIEEVRKSSGSWWDSDSSKRCYDQWQAVEKDEMRPSCGYAYETKKVKQSDGTFLDVKSRKWHSQGFCCHCTTSEKNAYTNSEARNFKRSGLTCKFATSSSQASAHCMRMDKLWYTVHTFGESSRDFTIHVRAFDQIEKVVNNKKIVESVNGGEIILSPSVKSGVGKYKRIIAHYVGDFAPVKSYPVLSERYFLIPKKSKGLDQSSHLQTKEGVSKFLIFPMSMVDLHKGACDKIGVGYAAFKNQAAGGVGFGCHEKQGSCLKNQPWHFFNEDQERVNQGKTPSYFPARYGKLVGTRIPKDKDGKVDTEKGQVVLTYEVEEDHVSLVTLQISADDIILIYNRATGEIVRAAIKDFESLSMDGKLHVEVLNTGFVTADFHVSVASCSTGIAKIQERGASINPQVTMSFVFSLKTSSMEGTTYSCIVQLFDAKRALLGQRNVSFSTSTPCVCEQTACRCECAEGGGVKCIINHGASYVNKTLHKVNKGRGLFGSIGDFFKDILSFPMNLFNMFGNLFGGAWKWVQYIFLFIIVIVCVWLFNSFGGKALCGKLFQKRDISWNAMTDKMRHKKNQLKVKARVMKDELKEKAIEKKEKLKEKAIEKKDKLKEKAVDKKDQIKGKVIEKKDKLKEKAIEKKDHLKDKIIEKKDKLKDKAIEKKEDLKGKALHKKDQIVAKAQETKDRAKAGFIEKKEAIKVKAVDKKDKLKEKAGKVGGKLLDNMDKPIKSSKRSPTKPSQGESVRKSRDPVRSTPSPKRPSASPQPKRPSTSPQPKRPSASPEPNKSSKNQPPKRPSTSPQPKRSPASPQSKQQSSPKRPSTSPQPKRPSASPQRAGTSTRKSVSPSGKPSRPPPPS